jgi:thiosulfate/3-mercaptopyruvate sulfurtransferase
MGHDHAYLMQGNLDDWIALDGPIEKDAKTVFRADDVAKRTSTRYPIKPVRNVVSMEEILQILKTSAEEGNVKESDWLFIDARSYERFHGLVDEPRPNLRLGHIPGARNVPFMTLLDPNDVTKFRPVEDLRQIFITKGENDNDELDLITTPKKIVVSCGSGATACAVVAALELCGRDFHSTYVYDGSWAEWGSHDHTPIVRDST